MTATLQLLVKVALAKRTPPQEFLQLYNQLNLQQPVTPAEYVQELLLGSGDMGQQRGVLRTQYIIATALHTYSTVAGSLVDLFRHLHEVPGPHQQALILNGLTQKIGSLHLGSTNYLVPELLTVLAGYVEQALALDSRSLVRSIGCFAVVLGDLWEDKTVAAQVPVSFLDAIASLCDHLRSDSVDGPLADTIAAKYSCLEATKKGSAVDAATPVEAAPVAAPSTSALAAAIRSASSPPTVGKARRLVWLLEAVAKWRTDGPHFLALFELYMQPLLPYALLGELVSGAFDGFCVAKVNVPSGRTSVAERAWRGFITKRLPLLIRDSRAESPFTPVMNALVLLDSKVLKVLKSTLALDDPTGDTFMNLNMDDSLLDDDVFNSFPSTLRDMRHELLMALVQLEVMTIEQFRGLTEQKQYADLSISDDVLYLMLSNTYTRQQIEAEVSRCLYDENPEFVPFEELSLTGLFGRVALLMPLPQQADFVDVLLLHVERLAADPRESLVDGLALAKLHRLCLALALLQDVLDLVVSLLSPYRLVRPLVQLLDQWTSDSEDMNFQDLYSDFGCVLLLVVHMVHTYELDGKALGGEGQQLFVAQFLRLVGAIEAKGEGVPRSAGDGDVEMTFVGGDQTPAASRLAGWSAARGETEADPELLGGWINALFDAGGISDDLMSQSSVHECYRIVPQVFQQAVLACDRGMMDVEMLKSGLEYFLQPFLIVSTVGMLRWLESLLWGYAYPEELDNDDESVRLLLGIVQMFTSDTELSGEARFMHKVLLKVVAPGMMLTLRDFQAGNGSRGGGSVSMCALLLGSLQSVEAEVDVHDLVMLVVKQIPRGLEHETPSGLLGAQFSQLSSWCTANSSLPGFYHGLFALVVEVGGHDMAVAFLVEQLMKQVDDHRGTGVVGPTLQKQFPVVMELATSIVLVYGDVTVSSSNKAAWVLALSEDNGGSKGAVADHGLLRAVVAMRAAATGLTKVVVDVWVSRMVELIEHVETIY